MLEFWQNLPLHIDPILFHVGNFAVRWYSLSYLAAFLTVFLLLRHRISKKEAGYQAFQNKQALEEFFIFAIIGIMIGARLGYLLFYDFSTFVAHPLASLLPFQQGDFTGFFGLSYHGGLLGAIIAGMLFCKKNKVGVLRLANFIIPAIPLGYMWGRLGNFMNGELFGRQTENFLGMRFSSEELFLRHPSQLYEALGEGLFLFFVLWSQRNNARLKNKTFALYLLLYGVVRFIIEFFREPDAHLGITNLGLTMGQLLCFGMIIAGFVLFYHPRIKKYEDSGN